MLPDEAIRKALNAHDVSIRFKVRGASRRHRGAFGNKFTKWFQSALRFAVLPDDAKLLKKLNACKFQSALRFAVLPDKSIFKAIPAGLLFQSALRFAVLPDSGQAGPR